MSRFQFYFTKEHTSVKLIRYRRVDVEQWMMLDSEYQDLVHHRDVCSKSSVKSAIEDMVRYRTVTVSLSNEESAPYTNLEFGDTAIDDEITDSQSSQADTNSQSSDLAPLLQALSQYLTRQENFSRRPAKMNIDKYDGKRFNHQIWLENYETVCQTHGVRSDKEKIQELRNYLENNALKWYEDKIKDDFDNPWQDWKECFLLEFGEDPLQAGINAYNYKYRGGSLLDYYYEKQRLINIGWPNLDNQNFIKMVMIGLPEDIQNSVSLLCIKTPMELKMALKKIRSNKPTIVKQNNQISKPSKKPTSVNKAEKVANSCVASEFLNKIDNPVYNVCINGYKFESLIDSGSCVNLIQYKVARKAGLDLRSTSMKIQGFNGISQVKHTTKTKVLIDSNEKEVEFYVSDNIPYPIIIGRPGMKEHGFHLCKTPQLSSSPTVLKPKEDKIIKSKDCVKLLFPQLCSQNLREPKFTVDFVIQESEKPICYKPRKVNEEKLRWLKMKIKEMLERKLIRESTSSYASPIVIVPKESGEYRLCIDFRSINERTVLDPFPFPIIDDIISRYGGFKYFSKIDLKDGFWQLGITEKTRKFTAFVTPFGQYECVRLPFGWKNSPPKFQRVMTKVLGDLLDTNQVSVYIDDICIGGKTLEECQTLTYKVLQRLESYNLNINIDKSEFNVNSVKFLGRTMDGLTKTTNQESVDKVKNMSRPDNLHALRRFTGLTGHFRAFIKDYAKLVRPLDKLKQKDVPFVWSEECENSFQRLKILIAEKPILQLPDWNLPFELCTDASNYGTGAILYQRDVSLPRNRQLRVIGYYSHTFTKPEVNYPTTQKEGLAVIKAIKYFQSYLEGKSFTVHTDHQALTHLMTLKEPKGRLGRWQVFLMSYDIKINHRPGSLLTDADAISRLCVDSPDNKKSLVVSNDQKLPQELDRDKVSYVLKRYHDDKDSGGHDGFMRTYHKIRSRFKWKGMKKDIYDHVRSCHLCQMVKAKFRAKQDIPCASVLSEKPYETIHIDFGELKKKSEESRVTQSFLLVIDEATRMLSGKAMKENTVSVIEFLEQLPFIETVKVIVSDNGTAFTSKQFRDWAKSRNTELKNTSPYHPASNGLVERRMQDVKKFIELYRNTGNNWKELLNFAIQHHNRSYNTTNGCSPYFKANKESATFPADEEFNIRSTDLKEVEKPAEEVEKQRQKRYSKQLKSKLNLNVRDQILIKPLSKQCKTTGPYKIEKVNLFKGIPKSFIYKNERGSQQLVHVSNTTPYHVRSRDSSK